MALLLPPPALDQLPYGAQLVAGMGKAMILADMDFETFSEAGYVWHSASRKWSGLLGAAGGKKGLPIVGAARYAEHPSTEVLCLWFDLKDGKGRQFWKPGLPPPFALFDHIKSKRLVEAWNVGFERWIWEKVCMPKYGWPAFPHAQMRCAMAKSRASALPGKLGKAGDVLRLSQVKDKEGERLIKKFCMPRTPTLKDRRVRITPEEDLEVDGAKLYRYGCQDIVTEAEASSRIPDLEGEELEYWLVDQAINYRGVQLDVKGVNDCIAIVNQAHTKYNAELYHLTGGAVARASELAKLVVWLGSKGLYVNSLDEEHLDEALKLPPLPPGIVLFYHPESSCLFWSVPDVFDGLCHEVTLEEAKQTGIPIPPFPIGLTPECRRALEIRAAVGSAAVKKVFAMANQVCADGRLRDLFSYHAARTGRATGNGPQPTNMPNSGPSVHLCTCGHHCVSTHVACPWCGAPFPPGMKAKEWNALAVLDALEIISHQSLELVEFFFGDAMAAVSGCLRGLFISAPGKKLICSDYSAIEAVVAAELAGEQWRIDVFATHGKIYEMSASKITGIPFNDYMKHVGYTDEQLATPDWYKQEPASKGSHHPTRKTIGKVAELASAYQGWVGSWKAFGADEFFTDEEMKDAILAWRAASPAIVEFWGGQERNWKTDHYGIEGMFVSAILNPGHTYECRGHQFTMRGDALYLRLISGRHLTYHAPRLEPGGRRGLAISYEGWNSNPKNGPTGWIRMYTWGGRLFENICQATARDIQRYGMINLEKAGYPIVLHVYDEDIAEVPEDFGSVEELEKIMATMPPWAAGWPIKANGGWSSTRYRKG